MWTCILFPKVSWQPSSMPLESDCRREKRQRIYYIICWDLKPQSTLQSCCLSVNVSILSMRVCQEKMDDLSTDPDDRAGKCLCMSICQLCVRLWWASHFIAAIWYAVSGWPKRFEMLCHTMSLCMKTFSKNNSTLGLLLWFLTGLLVEF